MPDARLLDREEGRRAGSGAHHRVGPASGAPWPRLRTIVALIAAGLLVAACSSSSDDSSDSSGDADDAANAADEDSTGAGDNENLAPNAWDPSQPINLSGVEGVSAEEQAAAEELLADTLEVLPERFGDPADAEAEGYHSIQDSMTGFEHFVNWDYRADETILEPERPESLVYEVQEDGGRTLVAAMYMLPPGSTLDDVPAELDSGIVQWHIHQDLCYTKDDPPVVGGVVEIGDDCPDHLQAFDAVPMVHVWVTPHECGPFSALEGIGGGQVAEGEEHLCDEAHGHHDDHPGMDHDDMDHDE